MLLLPVALAAGAGVGYLFGGRLRHLAGLRVRAPVLLGLALALQVGVSLAPADARFPVVAFSYALVGAWLVVNIGGRRRRLGLVVGLLAAGWFLNLAVIVPNGGMPVSEAGMARAGVPSGAEFEDGNIRKHVAGTEGRTLSWLGDVIPVPALRTVISAGDVVLLAGIVLAVAMAMTDAGRAPAPAAREASS